MKPGELCQACSTARAVEHYHGTPAVYCERCKPLQEAALHEANQRAAMAYQANRSVALVCATTAVVALRTVCESLKLFLQHCDADEAAALVGVVPAMHEALRALEGLKK